MNWKQQHQKILTTAKTCNHFFDVDFFTDDDFKIKIPQTYAQLIDINEVNNPLLKQVLPIPSTQQTGFKKEPLGEEQYMPVNGLIHKYKNRVLLIASSVCAIHCRYCFRQNLAYQKHDIFKNLPHIIGYINQHLAINEIILSGGDPLSLDDEKIAALLMIFAKMKHIKTIRIHTRTAVVLPSRISHKLVDILINHPQKVVIVFHINHAQEISTEFKEKVSRFGQIIRLNQSVLLAGVNDTAETLIALSYALFECGILPYYLHQLDKVIGAEHFLVSDKIALNLHRQLKENLSGYLVPKLVRDNNNISKDWLS